MKILKLSLLVILPLLMSCGGDDPLSESIVGTWNLLSLETTGCTDPDDNVNLTEVDSSDCIVAQGDTLCNVFIVFSADGTAVETYTEDSGQENEDFTYTTNDDNNTASLCESANDCETLTFDEDTMTRTITDDGCVTKVVYTKA